MNPGPSEGGQALSTEEGRQDDDIADARSHPVEMTRCRTITLLRRCRCAPKSHVRRGLGVSFLDLLQSMVKRRISRPIRTKGPTGEPHHIWA